jgi:hypothetical protein
MSVQFKDRIRGVLGSQATPVAAFGSFGRSTYEPEGLEQDLANLIFGLEGRLSILPILLSYGRIFGYSFINCTYAATSTACAFEILERLEQLAGGTVKPTPNRSASRSQRPVANSRREDKSLMVCGWCPIQKLLMSVNPSQSEP